MTAGSASPGTRPRRRRIPRALMESLLIVFSILLAFALNGWWETRQRTRAAEHALASFEQEISRNRESLLRVAPYHRNLLEQFARISAEGSVRTFDDLRRLEGFEGFRPAFLTSAAWHSAMATGVLEHLEFDMVATLSQVYTLQERFSRHSETSFLAAPGALADENIGSTVLAATIYLTDVRYGAEELIENYERALRRLAER